MESKGCGVLDTPLEPVIGLAEGETRWRGMTAVVGVAPRATRVSDSSADASCYSDSGAVAASSQTLVASSTCGRTSWRTLA
jgi:hypothetical protein